MPTKVSEPRPSTAPARLKRRDAEYEEDSKFRRISDAVSHWHKLILGYKSKN